MKARHACFLAGLALTLPGCGDDPTSPTTCDAETAEVTATVSVGQSVVFDWEPSCGVAVLLIEEDAHDMWGIQTDEADWDDPEEGNAILPPVTYGSVTGGVTQVQEPETLVSGVTYELILWRILPENSAAQCASRFENLCLVTVTEFTR